MSRECRVGLGLDSADSQSPTPSASTPERKPQTPQQNVRKIQIKLIAITLIAAILFLGVLAGLGYLGSPAEALSISQVNFNFSCSSSQVLFSLTNTGSVDLTIAQVEAAQAGAPGQLVTTQLASNLLPKGSSTILSAFFPGSIFVGGAVYTFTLLTSRGASFITSALVPSVSATEQLNINQVSFSGNQVTFALSNGGSCDISIVLGTVRGPGISGTVSGIILSGSFVAAQGSSDLVVNFSGITFQSGSKYTFALTTARGNRFQVQTTA